MNVEWTYMATPQTLESTDCPNSSLIQVLFCTVLEERFFSVIQGYRCLTGECLNHLGGQGISRHTSSYLYANSCCPNYESFSSIHVSKSWRFSIWQHLFARFMAHKMARATDLLFEVFNFHDTTFAFGFIGCVGLGTFVRAPYCIVGWRGGRCS